MTDVVLVKQTSVLTDAQVAAVVPILQTLFDRDFEPVWNTKLAVRVSAYPMGWSNACWPIFLLDMTDQPGAGGYHEDQGRPFGKVFVKDAIEANESWTVDLTHEFLEMCADPTTDRLVSLPSMPGFDCLREVGDAVEADNFGYMINGVLVTDWVTPEYFFQVANDAGRTLNPTGNPRGQYDFMGHINAPAPALLHGGYLGIRNPQNEWGQISNFVNGAHSRRAKRASGRLSRAARR